MRWGRLLRSASLVLGSGYVLFLFSERVFWSLWRPGDDLAIYVAGWLLHAFMGYLLLAAVQFFRVSNLWSLLLAGAFFGWLDEGVYAMTLFGDEALPFPLTIVWTGRAWHAPITVVLGWYGLRRAMQATSRAPGLLLSGAIGLFWGFWAVAWGRETPPVVAAPLEFLAHAAAMTALLALSQAAITAGRPAEFRPSRAGLAVASVVVAAFFALVTVPAVPFAPLVLLPLFAVLWAALRRGRARERRSEVLVRMGEPVRPRNLASLALIPLAATAIYAGLNAQGWLVPSHQIVAVATTVAGAVLFIVAVVKQGGHAPKRLRET